jgi:hypothetical protein
MEKLYRADQKKGHSRKYDLNNLGTVASSYPPGVALNYQGVVIQNLTEGNSKMLL